MRLTNEQPLFLIAVGNPLPHNLNEDAFILFPGITDHTSSRSFATSAIFIHRSLFLLR